MNKITCKPKDWALKDFFVILLLLFVIMSFNFTSENHSRFIAPSVDIRFFTLGYKEAISDSFWVRLIQDFDFCDQNTQNRDLTESKTIQYSGFSCHKGWVYQMLDVITELTPKNRMPYTVGAVILSVLVNDKEGARLIFEKGVTQFPTDWNLNYRAAYHYLIELNDSKRAAELLHVAAQNGAPPWVYSLASKLFLKEGRQTLSVMALKSYLSLLEESPYRDRIQNRLERILKDQAADPDIK